MSPPPRGYCPRNEMLRDHSVAFDTHQEAARKGDRLAQYKLGVMYGLGLGVEQSYGESVRWYREAAENGLAQAQCNLGFMYGTGRGVPQDYVFAYAWYNVAAASGEDTARGNRDAVAERMSPAQVEAAQTMSRELFERIESGG